MNNRGILGCIEIENIYKHILRLEGERHPLRSPESLKKACQYIYQQLENYCSGVQMQDFMVDGWEKPFYNVEACLGKESEPGIVLIAHYDTYYKSAGANDNAASVAVLLEIARILGSIPTPPSIRFVFVSLEESNPVLEQKCFQSAWKYQILDEDLRYTSYETATQMGKFWLGAWGLWKQGSMAYSEALVEAAAQVIDNYPVSERLKQHFEEVENIYQDVILASGKLGHLGSHAWVVEALEANKNIRCAICLDEIGTTNMQEGSQRMFPGLSYGMLKTHKVEPEKRIGNWAFILTDKHGAGLGDSFCTHCTSTEIDLPYAYLNLPMTFDQILQINPQALASDHVPFWKAGIPALALIDTAAMRNPFGHSMADTIDRLDFAQIERVCKATLATIRDL